MSAPALPPLNPEMEAVARAAVDRSHLRILEIIFYVAGGITIVFSCFFILHLGMFLMLGLHPQFFTPSSHGAPGQAPPAGLFLVLAAAIGMVIALGWIFGALQIWAGYCLRQRRHVLAILIIAGAECLFLPWGTALGICTILVLQRPSVHALFR